MLGKVLVVDDEKPLANALNLKLKKENIDVTAVYSGIDAVELIKKEKYKVILLDLMMPEMDGFAVLEFIRQNKYKTKVIVTSNLSQEEDIAKVTALGAVKYFVKSNTSINDIINFVKTLLHESSE